MLSGYPIYDNSWDHQTKQNKKSTVFTPRLFTSGNEFQRVNVLPVLSFLGVSDTGHDGSVVICPSGPKFGVVELYTHNTQTL